jgi:hypothetical protein
MPLLCLDRLAAVARSRKVPRSETLISTVYHNEGDERNETNGAQKFIDLAHGSGMPNSRCGMRNEENACGDVLSGSVVHHAHEDVGMAHDGE